MPNIYSRMKLLPKFFLVILLLTAASVSIASDWYVTPSYIKNLQSGWTLYGRTKTVKPSENKIQLKKSIDETLQLKLERHAFDNNKIMILAAGNTIIAEKYNVSKNISPAGNSMSKSVLSLLVGQVFCSGAISSLNDKVENYVSALKGTNWGESSIENLLTMSSGAYYVPSTLMGQKNKEMQKEMSGAIFGNTTPSISSILKKHDEKKFKPGKQFIYSNADTSALGLVLRNATNKPIHVLTQRLWNEVGANKKATWLVNSRGETMSYMGFAASPNDWILLGHYVNQRLRGDDCFADYLKAATTTQIANSAFADNRDYGYQIWTECEVGSGAFCFVGALGQLLMIEPEKELVLYIHSTNKKWGGMNHWGTYLWVAYQNK